MGEETRYVYDNAGNLIEKADAKGQKTEYVYDDSGRLTDVRYYAPTDLINPVKEVDFTYDNVGNLKTYNDGTTSASYEYDNAYRKTSEAVNYGSFTKSFSYTYYDNGLKKSFTGPDGITYSYAYDANNQLAGIEIPGQGSITYSAYNWNRPTNITLPGGTTKSYTYDPLMRVMSIISKDPGGNDLINYQYNYDKMDNIIYKNTEHGDYSYGYDDLYRLTMSYYHLIKGESLNETFTYDKVGNRLTSADTTGNWSYNQNNELQIIPPSSSNSTGGSSYIYDDNGNMTRKTIDGVVTNYIYDIDDRITEVRDSSDSLIAKYYCDPSGRRLWKEVDGTRIYFLYADEGLIGEYEATGTEIKIYGYIPNSTWTTDPLFMKVGLDYYYYHNDHLGTPQKMTSVNGEVVWSALSEVFGKIKIDITSNITNNLRFPGQYEDQETGMYYNYYRYYNPKIGRYLSKDPVGLDDKQIGVSLFGSQQDLNVYVYVNNMPNYAIDEFGLQTTLGKQCPSGQHPCPKKGYQPSANGCGPAGWKIKVVPNKPFFMANFLEPCNGHDICYGTCNNDKATCDENFLGDMAVKCNDKYGWMSIEPMPTPLRGMLKTCFKLAETYYKAVSSKGTPAYNAAQDGACDCCSCKP